MNKLRTLKLSGSKFSFVNLKEFLTIHKDVFIGKEYKFETNNSSPFIIDCGSHIGVSVIYFKKLYPKAKILAFEPNPQNFKILKTNVTKNDLKEVELVNAVLTNREGEVDFYISKEKKSPWTWGDSAAKNVWYDPKTHKTIKVKAVCLSSYIKKKVDLIKLDIEGLEEQVLEEISGKLKLVKEIVMEFHGSSTNKQNRVENILSILDKNLFDYTIKQKGKLITVSQVKKTDPYWLIIHAKKKQT